MHWGRRIQRDAGDVGDGEPQVALSALLQKGAGAGGTGVVHRVVDGHPVAQEDVLGILSADLEDRFHFRIEVRRAGRMGRDFVVDVDGPEVGAQQFAGGAGRAHQPHRTVAHLVGERVQALAGRRHGIAARAQVVRGHDAAG